MGGERFRFAKYVWSPAGGWGANPPNAARNIKYAYAGMIVLCGGVFYVSATNERRYRVPDRPIPSQRWATHTLEDDPEYPQKLVEYKKNKPSFFSRILPDKNEH